MKCVILGAGKIARGFIGHLLYLSEIPFTFVEKAEGLVDLINERGQYTVNILGNSEKNCVVKNARAIHFSDVDKIAEEIAQASVVFTSVLTTSVFAVSALTTSLFADSAIVSPLN